MKRFGMIAAVVTFAVILYAALSVCRPAKYAVVTGQVRPWE